MGEAFAGMERYRQAKMRNDAQLWNASKVGVFEKAEAFRGSLLTMQSLSAAQGHSDLPSKIFCGPSGTSVHLSCLGTCLESTSFPASMFSYFEVQMHRCDGL